MPLFKVNEQYELGFKLKYFNVPCSHEFVSISKKSHIIIS